MPKALPVIDISAPVCCAPVAAGPIGDDDALAVALRLKALADPARVKIMSLLFGSRPGRRSVAPSPPRSTSAMAPSAIT